MDERSKPAQKRSDIPKIDAANNEAARGLRAVEAGATSEKPAETGDNLEANRANEEAANGYYTGSGRETISYKGKGKGKSFLKGKGPIGLILGIILGFGGLFSVSQLFQPFALVENFKELFNSMHVSVNNRSDTFFKMQMGSGKVKNPIKGTLFRGDTFNISTKQRNRLAKQGIEVEGSGAGTVLKYTTASGEVKTVTASDFKNTYYSDPDFFNKYNAGSMTWRGAISNWFGEITTKFLRSNKITRNLFKKYLEEVDSSDPGSSRRVAIDLMSEGSEEIKGGRTTGAETREIMVQETDPITGKPLYNADGSPRMVGSGEYEFTHKTDTLEGGVSWNRATITEGEVKSKLQTLGEKYSGKANTIVNIACGVANFVGAVTLMVNASNILQIANLTTGYLEAIDKAKIGYAEESPINDFAQILNEPTENTHKVYRGIFNSVTEETTDGTAMEAEGIAGIFERRRADTNDASIRSFNFSSNTKGVLSSVANWMAGGDAFETCAIAKVAANTVSSIAEATEIAGCIGGLVGSIFTLGVSAAACLPLVTDGLLDFVKNALLGGAISLAVSLLTPVVVEMFTRDIIKNIGGEDLGNALVSGANIYMGNTHRANGGSLANVEKYTEFALAREEVIAENAKYERMNRSPFDATSKYTFMGSLLTQLMSFLSSNSLLGIVSTSSSVLTSSIVAISPTAKAATIAETLPSPDEFAETCPYLASIGAVGDSYCNPYSITDVSTINEDPAEFINILDEQGNFLDETTSEGNVKINAGSDLAKYILFCDNRASSFGFADQNISSQIATFANVDTGRTFRDSFANAALGAIPAVGDIIDIAQNTQVLTHMGYISGESCVAGNQQISLNAPDWETAKNYQRFIEDQSLAESMGLIEKSAVSAFLDEYYEQNPLDNSYEGVLARYSGLDKETVVAVLDIIDYGNYIASYDSSTRYQFGQPLVEMPDRIIFETNDYVAVAPAAILVDSISFADVRNRNFVV